MSSERKQVSTVLGVEKSGVDANFSRHVLPLCVILSPAVSILETIDAEARKKGAYMCTSAPVRWKISSAFVSFLSSWCFSKERAVRSYVEVSLWLARV